MIRQVVCLCFIVGNEENGGVRMPVKAGTDIVHGDQTDSGIQSLKGFVQQKEIPRGEQRAQKGRSAPLASGQLADRPEGVVR